MFETETSMNQPFFEVPAGTVYLHAISSCFFFFFRACEAPIFETHTLASFQVLTLRENGLGDGGVGAIAEVSMGHRESCWGSFLSGWRCIK